MTKKINRSFKSKKFKQKYVFLFLFVFLNLGFVFANSLNTDYFLDNSNYLSQPNNITINQITASDVSNNVFYLSKNTTKEIEFEIFYNPSESYDEKYIVYDYELISNNTNIFFELSNSKSFFYSDIKSNLVLRVDTHDFENQKARLMLKIDVYDSLDNKLSSKIHYINFKSNNQELDFQPLSEYVGYKISRPTSVLEHIDDYDIITITITSTANTGFDVYCEPSSNFFKAEVIPTNKTNVFDLNISLNNDLDLEGVLLRTEEERTSVSCYTFNAYEKKDLKNINVLFFNKVNDIDVLEFKEKDKTNSLNKSKISALFVFSKDKTTLSFLFLFVLALLLLSIFSKKK